MGYLKNFRISDGRRRMTKAYKTWINIRYRCANQSHKKYKYYGGKGIKVCDEWQSFANLRSWAIASGICRGLTIDRVDNDGNYEPSNCRWATLAVQSENSSHPIVVEFDGERLNKSQWAKHLGISHAAMHQRLIKWPLEAALTRPKNARCPPI